MAHSASLCDIVAERENGAPDTALPWWGEEEERSASSRLATSVSVVSSDAIFESFDKILLCELSSFRLFLTILDEKNRKNGFLWSFIWIYQKKALPLQSENNFNSL